MTTTKIFLNAKGEEHKFDPVNDDCQTICESVVMDDPNIFDSVADSNRFRPQQPDMSQAMLGMLIEKVKQLEAKSQLDAKKLEKAIKKEKKLAKKNKKSAKKNKKSASKSAKKKSDKKTAKKAGKKPQMEIQEIMHRPAKDELTAEVDQQFKNKDIKHPILSSDENESEKEVRLEEPRTIITSTEEVEESKTRSGKTYIRKPSEKEEPKEKEPVKVEPKKELPNKIPPKKELPKKEEPKKEASVPEPKEEENIHEFGCQPLLKRVQDIQAKEEAKEEKIDPINNCSECDTDLKDEARFICSLCGDYILCELCELRTKHEHVFIKVPKNVKFDPAMYDDF